MRTTAFSALVAAALVAGVAQAATTFDSPTQAGEASTMTMGQPNLLTTNSPYPDGGASVTYTEAYPDTTVLGAGPATTTITTYRYTDPVTTVYATPGYVVAGPAVSPYWNGHEGAAETSNVPNMLTNNYGY